MIQQIENQIKSLVSAKLFLEAEWYRNIVLAIQNGATNEDIDKAMDFHLSLKGGTRGTDEALFIKNLIRDNVQH